MTTPATLDITQIIVALTPIIVAVLSLIGLIGVPYIAYLMAGVKSNSLETKLTAMQTNITALETKAEVDKVHDVVNSNETAMKTRMAEMTSQILALTAINATLVSESVAAKVTAGRAEGIAEGRAGAPTPYPTVAGNNGGLVPDPPATVINTDVMNVEADTVSVDQKKPFQSSPDTGPGATAVTGRPPAEL